MAQYLLLNTRCYFPYFFPRLQCFCNVYFCSRFFKGYYSLFASSSCELALAGQDECRFNVVVRVRILPDKKKKKVRRNNPSSLFLSLNASLLAWRKHVPRCVTCVPSRGERFSTNRSLHTSCTVGAVGVRHRAKFVNKREHDDVCFPVCSFSCRNSA